MFETVRSLRIEVKPLRFEPMPAAENSPPVRVDPAVLDRRRARRRARVLKRLRVVVETLLAEDQSYADLTIDRIIDEGEMARSTFYSYFDNKADLIIALGETAMDDILRASRAFWELPPGTTREQLAAAVRYAIETYLPHIRLANAMLEASASDPRARDRVNGAYVDAQRAAARHIKAGQKADLIRQDLHAEEAAGWLTWMIERGMTQLVQHAHSPARLRRLEDTCTSILWYALYDRQGRP